MRGVVTYPCGVVLRVRVCVCGGAVVLCSFVFGQLECKLEVLVFSFTQHLDVLQFPSQAQVSQGLLQHDPKMEHRISIRSITAYVSKGCCYSIMT